MCYIGPQFTMKGEMCPALVVNDISVAFADPAGKPQLPAVRSHTAILGQICQPGVKRKDKLMNGLIYTL